MESKRDETFGSDLFGTNANKETWSGRQPTNKAAMRVPGASPGGGRPPPSWAPCCSIGILPSPIYTPVP